MNRSQHGSKLGVSGLVFDMYGTVVDVGAVAEACRLVADDPVAFNGQWRAKQLEYTFLRSAMGTYQDFWKVSEQALEYTIRRFGLTVSPSQRKKLMAAWLQPTPYPEVGRALPRLRNRYPLAILSNGSPAMLRTGLDRVGLRPHFRWVLEAPDPLRLFELLRCRWREELRVQGVLDQSHRRAAGPPGPEAGCGSEELRGHRSRSRMSVLPSRAAPAPGRRVAS